MWTFVIPALLSRVSGSKVAFFWLANQKSQQGLSEPITIEYLGTNLNCTQNVLVLRSATGQTKLSPQIEHFHYLNVFR